MGYTVCPGWVVAAIVDEASRGGQCQHVPLPGTIPPLPPSPPSPNPAAPPLPIAGYVPSWDVTGQSKIDLDQNAMEPALKR